MFPPWEPGEKVIVCRNGVFGERMRQNVERCGGIAVMVDHSWGEPVDPAPTGTIIPADELAAIAADPQVRQLADERHHQRLHEGGEESAEAQDGDEEAEDGQASLADPNFRRDVLAGLAARPRATVAATASAGWAVRTSSGERSGLMLIVRLSSSCSSTVTVIQGFLFLLPPRDKEKHPRAGRMCSGSGWKVVSAGSRRPAHPGPAC